MQFILHKCWLQDAASSSKMPLKGEILAGSKGQVLKCGPPILAAGNTFRKDKRPDGFKQKATWKKRLLVLLVKWYQV